MIVEQVRQVSSRLTHWQVETNVKLVMTVDRPLADLRAELTAKGVPMGEITSYPPLTGRLCGGNDPEGNVFQLAEALTDISNPWPPD